MQSPTRNNPLPSCPPFQHQRQVGCLHAKFKVLADVPKASQHGMFAAEHLGREFDAYLRVSGDPPNNTDSSPEARGFSIKVSPSTPTVFSILQPLITTVNMSNYTWTLLPGQMTGHSVWAE